MVTGAALFEVLRPRRSKALPKGFAPAVTANRVVAFSAIGVGEEDGENYHVVVRGSERGSWPREGVSFEGLPGKSDGTLNLAGEVVPVCRGGRSRRGRESRRRPPPAPASARAGGGRPRCR